MEAVASTVLAVARAVIKTVFVMNPEKAVTRSAAFLLVFVVFHSLANLVVLAGPEAYNNVAAMLESPVIQVIEAYLFLGFIVHALSTSFKTLKSGKLQQKWTWRSLSLSITGTVLLVFLVVHLRTFRFRGTYSMYTVPGGGALRDMHAVVLLAFSSPMYCMFYLVVLACLWWHLQRGWVRAVLHLDIAREYRTHAKALGSVLATLVCCMFALVVVYSHLREGAV